VCQHAKDAPSAIIASIVRRHILLGGSRPPSPALAPALRCCGNPVQHIGVPYAERMLMRMLARFAFDERGKMGANQRTTRRELALSY